MFSGLTIAGFVSGLKFFMIAALAATLAWYVWDYNTLRGKNVQLSNDVARLESNIEVERKNYDTLKLTVDSLNRMSSDQLKRFVAEQDIWRKIDESADPMTDAANWSIRAKTPEPKGKTK